MTSKRRRIRRIRMMISRMMRARATSRWRNKRLAMRDRSEIGLNNFTLTD